MTYALTHAVAHAASYLDPGTGSMLFTLLVGVLSASYFFFRKLAIRARFAMSGGKAAKADERLGYVIFSDDKRYWNVFQPICDEFERRGIACAFWTASPDDPALDASYEHVTCEFVGENNKAFARLNMMSADVVLSTTPGLGVYQWKRSKDVGSYVHVLHSVDTAAGYRMFGLDYYDAVLLTGEFEAKEVRALEQMRGIAAKDLEVVGCTYLDTAAERFAAAPERQDAQRTVLLAPSWGSSAILSVYGERIIEALVSTGWRVVVRPHPQSMKSEREMMDRLMAAYPNGEAVEWNFDTDNFDVLCATDVMITDFSGIIYDFALVFDKPVIYAEGQFDPAEYDAAWFDEPLRKFEHFPLMGIPLVEEQLPRMKEVLEEAVADQTLAAGRASVRDEVWQHRGEAAGRVVDYMVSTRERLQELAQKKGDDADGNGDA